MEGDNHADRRFSDELRERLEEDRRYTLEDLMGRPPAKPRPVAEDRNEPEKDGGS